MSLAPSEGTSVDISEDMSVDVEAHIRNLVESDDESVDVSEDMSEVDVSDDGLAVTVTVFAAGVMLDAADVPPLLHAVNDSADMAAIATTAMDLVNAKPSENTRQASLGCRLPRRPMAHDVGRLEPPIRQRNRLSFRYLTHSNGS